MADDHSSVAGNGETMVSIGEDFPELRDSVRRICAKYPGA